MSAGFSHSHATLTRRVHTTAFAALAIAAQLFTLIHVALVRHERCAEHGEVVHRGHAEADSLALRAPVPVGNHVVESSHTEQSHDHCGVATERRHQSYGQPAQSTAPGVPDVQPSPLALLADTVAVYRRAPKTSPPLFG